MILAKNGNFSNPIDMYQLVLCGLYRHFQKLKQFYVITVRYHYIDLMLLESDRFLQGPPSPWGNDAFPPCFRFPPCFQEKISDSVKNFPNSTFSPNFSHFHPPKISNDLFLVINCQIYVFFTYFVFFVSPLLWPWCIYAAHNARTGRPWFSVLKNSIDQDWLGSFALHRICWNKEGKLWTTNS